jgi:hypothetical protein
MTEKKTPAPTDPATVSHARLLLRRTDLEAQNAEIDRQVAQAQQTIQQLQQSINVALTQRLGNNAAIGVLNEMLEPPKAE